MVPSPLARMRGGLLLVVVVVVYATLARLGEAILPLDGIAALWPASGFAAVMLLWAQTRSRRAIVLAGVVLGVGLSILIRGMFFTNELGYLLGNLVEPLVMLPFLMRATWPRGRMDRLVSVAWLVAGAVVATASAAVVVASLATWSFDGTGDVASTWPSTWVSFTSGDLLGLLLVAPLMLQAQPPSRIWRRGSPVEQAILWAALAAALLLTWVEPVGAAIAIVVLIVFALRLDSAAASAGALLLASVLVADFVTTDAPAGDTALTALDVRVVLPFIAVLTQLVAMGTTERLNSTAHADAARISAERAEATLGGVLAAAPVGIALYDVRRPADGQRPEFALAFMSGFGIAEGRLSVAAETGADHADFLPDIQDAGIYDEFIAVWTDGAPRNYTIDNSSSETKWRGIYENHVTSVGPDQILVVWTDVTALTEARNAAEQSAAEAERSRSTLRHALDSGLDAFAIYERDPVGEWHLVFVNRAGAERSGALADELVGAPPELVVPVEAVQQVVPLMDVAHDTGRTQQTLADLTGSRSGWRGDFDITVTPTSGERVVVSWRDVSELQSAHRSLRSAHAAAMHAATHDALTNLPNRPLLLDRMTTALASLPRTSDGMAVVYLDIDNFKLINDRFGHATGDAVLIAVAQRLRTLTREGDTAARISGDEFAIVLTGVDAAWDESAFHERLTSVMATPVDFDGNSLDLSVSAGLTLACTNDRTPEELLHEADVALYASKSLGKGRLTVFTEGLRDAERSGRPTAGELALALQEDQLVLHYQPIVDLASSRLVGREALIRWQHPTYGLLSPAQFLDLADASGLISDVGQWVLERAVRDLAGEPGELWVSVNLAPTQVRRANVAESARRWCEEVGLQPSRLVLEVTESQLLEATPAVLRQLATLRDIGCRLAIDDFGSGYSSIAYLETFEFDLIKIDQGLLRGEQTDRKRAMVGWIVGLAETLGCRTIAEGVEDEAQAELVLRAGVELAQGFYYGHPAVLPSRVSLERQGVTGATSSTTQRATGARTAPHDSARVTPSVT